MAETQHWTCPYCNHDVTLQDQDQAYGGTNFTIHRPADGHKRLVWYYIVCPNPSCREYSLQVGLYELSLSATHQWETGDLTRVWDLVPTSKAKSFPDYVPKPVLDDYNEACLIVEHSPKASATLSRRCLQGMIRDFWGVKPGRLVDEIDQIEDRTDPLTWEAIQSVRKVGNIGAHMEKDINLILDVDPNEAGMLIELIEILIKDWYVSREERSNRLLQIKSIADQKDEARKKGKS